MLRAVILPASGTKYLELDTVLTSPSLRVLLGSARFGYLYNWYAVNLSPVPMAPAGWHIPTVAEWATLSTTASNDMRKLREIGNAHWNISVYNGTDDYGLSCLPTSYRHPTNYSTADLDSQGFYQRDGVTGDWWTADGYDATTAYWKSIDYNSLTMSGGNANKNYGFSVKMLKDNSTNPGTFTDRDGNVYDCITVGSQVWMKQDWLCTQDDDGSSIPLKQDRATEWLGLTTAAYCKHPAGIY